jgi:outer membrane protein OmpA-like peptidoglycan-associated protein
MRNLRILLTAAAVAVTPTLAHAQWYVGVDAGASLLEDSKVKGNNTQFKTSSDIGWLAQGQVGYAFGPWKVEGELSFRDNGVDKVSAGNGHGSTTALATMANGVYEFLPDSRWHPFVGVGIGAANVDAGTVSRNGTNVYQGDDWQFAYQGFAGVGYDISRNVALKAQYRYFATLDYDTKTTPGNQGLTNEYHDHALLFGFTYKFNAPAPAPVPAPIPVVAPQQPAPAPAPVAKAVAAKRNFIVFFDFDKAIITPEAARIIQQAASTANSTAVTRIDLTGHTDLSGSERYNQALSIKRGNSVKAELVKLGVPAAQIDVVGKGKSDPLVATPDGVREPQNRRVEIVLP